LAVWTLLPLKSSLLAKGSKVAESFCLCVLRGLARDFFSQRR
jgi:hypothetical protein